MHISSIQPTLKSVSLNKNNSLKEVRNQSQPQASNSIYNSNSMPADFRYNTVINFTGSVERGRRIPDIDFEEYATMNDVTKYKFRKKYADFTSYVDKDQLVDKKYAYLPLRNDRTMAQFIKTASIYNQYKDHQIICLGRSPKWFLNASLWMKDGIDKYKFVAFSKYWYRQTNDGAIRMDAKAPTQEQEKEYRKYLRRQQVDPKSIVETAQKTGKKAVITDYICSGKGACSFLDVMSRYAEDQGVLEDFAKSIQIVGIGSLEYMEDLDPYSDSISIPRVPMPEKLKPYEKDIKQEFYNMDYMMFREMLLNQNTNECRSTYYPCDMWTTYNPDRFKTGLIKDPKKIENLAKKSEQSNKVTISFTPAMRDYRNLLNFRILDGLNDAGLLKEKHQTK